MSEDDDWFEHAVHELENGDPDEGGASDDSDASGDGDGDADGDADSDGDADAVEEPTGNADEPGGGPSAGADPASDGEPDADEAAPEDGVGDDSFGGRDFGGEGFDDGDVGGDDGDSGGDANLDGEGIANGGGFDGGADGFGDGDFGPDAGGGGGGDFGFDDFEGGDADFGFGDEGPGGGESFDEEEFESDIERIELGIEGLDEMILGGVPRRSLIAAIGSAGTGKTTFALQFLHEALRNGDKAIYITLEESREAILSTAEEKGWPFREYAESDRLAIVALDPIEMANSLSSIRNDLSRLIREYDAERLVLDSVSLLEMMYDHPAERRSEVFDFTRSLKQAGVTTLLTSEASDENAYTSRHGIVEYLTDAVFILQYVRPSDFRETRLAVEIQKIRDANHSRETKPYEITNDGISVYRQANIF